MSATIPPPTRADLLVALHQAVQAQAAEPGGVDMLSIDVLAALQRLAGFDGARLVYPEHYDQESATYAYVGRRPCGCVRAATVDDHRDPRRIARNVAEMIESGLAVERVPTAYVRVAFGRCDLCDPPRPVQEGLPL